MPAGALLSGVLYALGAGLVWGLVFVAPVLMHDYPAAVLSVGRYLAFGLIALPIAAMQRAAIARLGRRDWLEAAKLSLVGNLLYYALLASAIQLAGAPLPTMLIGTLPVVIAVAGNLAQRELPWRRLALPLAAMAAGIALVNHAEFARLAAQGGDGPDTVRRYALGALLALGAVACWTWYPIRNAAWLKRSPSLRSDVWATAQGLATLPLALAGCALIAPFTDFDWPLGPRPLEFASLMLAIGFSASWLGTILWNRASQLLPTTLAGQLIVFETLSALLYAFLHRGEWPGAATLAGIAMLSAGVVLGVRAFQQRA